MRLGTGSLIDVTAAPTGITLTGGTVEENAAAGTLVASLSAIDSAGDTHTFTLVGGTTNLFEVAGSEVLVKSGAVLDFETQTSYDLTIRATDQDGLSCDRAVTIALLDVQETGTTGNDVLAGGSGDDTYVVNTSRDKVVEKAGEGGDTVRSIVSFSLGANLENLVLTGAGAVTGTGNSGDNNLTGNSAGNVLSGGAGSDVLDGSAGNDTLIGGEGADTYLFGRDDGADLIANGDMDGAADTLLFGAGIAEDQLWFARSGSDLVVSVLGASDHTTLQGWYSDLGNQLDHLELSDGSTLAAAQVQQLVDAMSAFPVPGAITDLSAPHQQVVETAIVANWHSAD
jgi:Ca2+-binding RTX toxin-like protein